MYGPQILARSLNEPRLDKKYGNLWQYHPRSDRHSKVACWAILFDLIQTCRPLARQIEAGNIGFGINHEMRDFRTGRKKDLDLVVCTRSPDREARPPASLRSLANKYEIKLAPHEESLLETMPTLYETSVGEVHVALEAKACMTEHGKARPRLYDELSSSHLTIHGSSGFAIAAGFVMVNISKRFISPDRNKFVVREHTPNYSSHNQPRVTESVIAKVNEIQRRSSTAETGFDAIGLVVVCCANDHSPFALHTEPPAPQPGDLLHYDSMIRRIAKLYESRFPHE